MDQLNKRKVARKLGQLTAIAVMTALAWPASAQQGMQRPSTATGGSTSTSTSTIPPRAGASFERTQPPIQVPSVDNNPNAARGQSLYPPRANADQR